MPFFLLARASILSEHTTLSFPQCKDALRQRLLPSRASPLSAGYDLSREAEIETDAVLFGFFFCAVETKIPMRGKALVATDLSISIP
ncbi:Deoxyuridine 5'-triphosphate nucleotidohydrolase [Arachis hypogaea]|nr:Deoxyuridine 5'-triphosphate nucleotidohydrolase [Arachis hypogaea]